jgi:hypothetical protein
MGPPSVAFYCVADAGYFLGVVGMINSLRLQGHAEAIFVLDCGLTPAQRELLARETVLVESPRDTAPWLLKTVAPLDHPAKVMVLIDADVIVTRPLTELIEIAARHRVVAFENNMDRFVPEWGDLLDLGPVRRQPYLCTAFVAMGSSPGMEVLRLMEGRQARVDFQLTHWRDNAPDYPFLYADQDVFNAILAARFEPGQSIVGLDHRLSPSIPFEGLRIVDEAALRLSSAVGPEPYLVHQSLSPKPWQEPVYDGVYSRLLRRLLCAPDLALRPSPREVPLRLRPGPLAYAERQRVNLREQLRWRLSGFRRQRFGAKRSGAGNVT